MTAYVATLVGLVRAVRAVLSSIRLLSVEIPMDPKRLGQTRSLLLVRLCGATLGWEELSDGRTVGHFSTRGGVGCGHLSGSLISAVDAFTFNLALDLQGSCLAGLCLLWQGLLDELGALQKIDAAGLENVAQLFRAGPGETHVIEEKVFIGNGEFPVRRQLKVHLCVVLRDFNSAVRLALHKQQGQLELLVRESNRSVDVRLSLHIVQQRVRHLDVPLLELGQGDLLLDELEEEFLLVTNSLTGVDQFFFSLLEYIGS